MLHGHGDFGQVPVSETDTWVLVRHLKSVPEEYPLFFLKKYGYIVDMVATLQNFPAPDTTKLQKKKKEQKKNRIWTNVSLFPSVL